MKRDVTLYQQVAMIFEKKIREGELPPGSKLPPTAELAKQFGVNPETIHLGLKLLIDQGLISRAPKRGTFVKEKLLHKTLGLIFPDNFWIPKPRCSPLSFPNSLNMPPEPAGRAGISLSTMTKKQI